MKQILKDIKEQNFSPVYLICGEESYLCKQFTDRLAEAIVGDDAMNVTCYRGKGIDIDQVILQAETMPFFASRRLIILEDTGIFKREAKELADYIPKLPETTHIIFREEQVDKRSRLYKKVKEVGYVAEMKRQTEKSLERWVLELLSKEGKQIKSSTMAFFIQTVGTDMNTLYQELQKLLAYMGERTVVEKQDIEAICTAQVTGRIFEMIDAISLKQQKKALQMYYDLLSLREPAMRILYLVSRQYLQLYQVREWMGEGMDSRDIASQMGLSSYIAGRVCKKAGTFRLDQLEQCLKMCAEMDEGIKTGKIKDSVAVELLIVQLSVQS